MTKKEASIKIVSALLSVAECAILKAYSALEDGSLRQRVGELHQNTITLQTAVSDVDWVLTNNTE